jgi:hypothetical protein
MPPPPLQKATLDSLCTASCFVSYDVSHLNFNILLSAVTLGIHLCGITLDLFLGRRGSKHRGGDRQHHDAQEDHPQGQRQDIHPFSGF